MPLPEFGIIRRFRRAFLLFSNRLAGLVFMEGPRILLGEDPILVRSHVSDLRTDEEHEALNKLELLLLGFRDEERGQS